MASTDLGKAPEDFFGRAPPLFGCKSTISRFGERFRDGQYSLVSFLFAILLLTVPPCPMELAPLDLLDKCFNRKCFVAFLMGEVYACS